MKIGFHILHLLHSPEKRGQNSGFGVLKIKNYERRGISMYNPYSLICLLPKSSNLNKVQKNKACLNRCPEHVDSVPQVSVHDKMSDIVLCVVSTNRSVQHLGSLLPIQNTQMDLENTVMVFLSIKR